jgi:hypothetical protein
MLRQVCCEHFDWQPGESTGLNFDRFGEGVEPKARFLK